MTYFERVLRQLKESQVILPVIIFITVMTHFHNGSPDLYSVSYWVKYVTSFIATFCGIIYLKSIFNQD